MFGFVDGRKEIVQSKTLLTIIGRVVIRPSSEWSVLETFCDDIMEANVQDGLK